MHCHPRAPCRPDYDHVVEVMERDHNKLENRDEANQHPISAISGLQDKLDLITQTFALQQQENQLMKERIQLMQQRIEELEEELENGSFGGSDDSGDPGGSGSGTPDDSGSGDSPTDDPENDDNIATDKEVDDMLDDIYGSL